MSEITIRDLRNHGGEVIARARKGETLIITRAGKPVAQLQPLDRAPLSARVLTDRWRHLPRLDGNALREDIDTVVDSAL